MHLLVMFISAHEVIERLEEASVQQFLTDSKTYRGRLQNEHTIDRYLTRLDKESQTLIDLYDDKDG
jgi:splicing factor 3A subunit 3